MADPTGYTVSYSFAGFQASSPTTPLPGPKLDNELAGIATAVAALVAAIKDIRRSDGKLNTGLVTFDSFESGLKLLLDPTNGQLVAAAVATAQAAQTAASGSATAAGTSATNSASSAAAAAASAATVNLSLYLAKANNLAGLGSLSTSRANLGLGSAALLNANGAPGSVMVLDGSARVPNYDGSQLTGIDTVPTGAVMWFPFTSAPGGYLKLNGALVSRVTYARLYAFAAASGNINTEATWASSSSGGFSTGDLSTTFRLPDLRGEFMRNFDDGAGADPGRVLAARQADSLKDHTHTTTVGATITVVAASGAAVLQPGGSATGSPSTGAAAETRPRNVALLACIKY